MGIIEALNSGADWLDAHTNPFHDLFGPTETEQKQANTTGAQPTPGWATQGVEKVSSGIAYIRDNFVSRPLSTFILEARKGAGSWSDLPNTVGDFVNGNEWKSSWNAAQHISPTQAFLFDTGKGSDAANARQLENAPLEYKRPQGLPQGFNDLPWQQQQDLLKNAGMPVQGNALVEQQRRASDFYKYGTGVGDFALSWWADPAVWAGKTVGALKEGAITQPITAATDIPALMKQSVMRNAQDYIFSNRDNPQLLNNLSLAKSSALGPRFGAIASTLRTPEEVNLFLRVGMGDTQAMDTLAARNAQAGDMIEKDTSRLPNLDLLHSKYADNPALQGLIEREIDRANSRIADNTDLVNRYNQVLGASHLIDQVNLTRASFARAEQQTALQNIYVAGAARRAGIADELAKMPSTSVVARVPRAAGAPLVGRMTQAEQQAMQSPIADLLPGGGQVASSRLYTNFFNTPLIMLRSFGEFRPNGHIGVQSIDRDSVNELRAFTARIPGLGMDDRNRIVNAYLTTTDESARANLLDGLERQGLRGIAQRHGFTQDEADAIYDAHQQKLGAEKAGLRGDPQYSTTMIPTATGGQLRADVFPDGEGAYKVAPNLVTRLLNDKQMVNLDHYDRILGRHSGAMQALRQAGGDAADWVRRSGDFLNSAWKFSTLLRLGYIPRVLGDDIGGQIARLGAANMALRAGYGIKNAATNVFRSYASPFLDARIAVRQEGMKYADSELGDLQPQIDQLEKMDVARKAANANDLRAAQKRVTVAQNRLAAMAPVTDPTDPGWAKYNAAQTLLTRHQGALGAAQLRSTIGLSPGQLTTLQSLYDRRDWLNQFKDLATRGIADDTAAKEKVYQGNVPKDIAPGLTVPGAFSGQRGQMYQELISSEDSLNTIFKANKQLVHGNLMRSWDHGAVPVNAAADQQGHMAAWMHVINAQFGNDALARQALAGDSVQQMTEWLERKAAGITYRKRLGENLTTAEDLARRVHYDVNEIAPTPGIRAAALSTDGVTADQLAKEIPDPTMRPDVHRAQLAGNLAGGNAYRQGLQKVMSSWFKWASEIPADRMSRHPLFNQLYEGHAQQIAQKETAQGRNLLTATDADRIAEQSRLLALRDMRKLVFDISHQSDAAAALRYISPFFAATTEAWQRWSRIVAEKPEVAGYAAKFFNVPLSMGVVQDKDGNPVDAEGYAYDPVTKQRTLVPKGDRHIVMRLPKFLVQGRNPIGLALGATPAGDINLSQDSADLVLSGDPWFNPGEGPIATIPLNEWVKDKPTQADMLQSMGVLPFGPATQTTLAGRVFSQIAPRTVKDFLSSYDTSDQRYQEIKAQIMQRAAFEHANFGKPMPSASQIADQTRNYWLFSAASAFLGPISGMGNDPYQFYRDEYNKMVRSAATLPKDQYGRVPKGQDADSQFLAKYGESYFVFAQQMSKNTTGVPATQKAVALERQYADLIAQSPELGALIVGPEGNGPFSPGAYAYQLNNPLVPGGAEMQRTRLTADQAMADNQKRLGWAKYTAKMNQLNAQLVSRGLQSFNDPGAGDLKVQKQAFTDLYTKPLFPDGSTNPYFIQAFADDFNSQNTQKYNEMIPALTQLARSPLANDPARSDLRVLQQYIGARQQLNQILDQRKNGGGSSSLTSSSNTDLANMWEQAVQQLILSNTSFGDLYHRYLSRDMQIDVAQRLAPQEGA